MALPRDLYAEVILHDPKTDRVLAIWNPMSSRGPGMFGALNSASIEEAPYPAMNVPLRAGDHTWWRPRTAKASKTVPPAPCEATGAALAPDHD
ncbi:hypothetical protein ACH4SK_43925 [Streptomyces inhibens]|uniref:hypothetical protein n=1 Tax=Streptomyces inhibens TaxID=2293571 RepID=UPI0037AA4868